MDLDHLIEALHSLVQEAKSMPLSSSVLVNRQDVLDLLEQMRVELPEEIRQARGIVRDREELLSRAKASAEEIVARGRQEQLRLAEHEEVVRRAHEEAARVLSEGQAAARSMRLDADAYADQKLQEVAEALRGALEAVGRSETTLSQGLAQAESGRERLAVPLMEAAHAPAHNAGPFDEDEGR